MQKTQVAGLHSQATDPRSRSSGQWPTLWKYSDASGLSWTPAVGVLLQQRRADLGRGGEEELSAFVNEVDARKD
jgi:hypothetical protein